jgi:histidinol-phosphate aminotransferase
MSAAIITARGREALVGEFGLQAEQAAAAETTNGNGHPIRLSSNENPLGPNQAALAAIETAFGYAGRYPMNAQPAMADLRRLIAEKHGLAIENVALSAGSGETLDVAAKAFVTTTKGVVAGLPTYESPAREAKRMKKPVTEIAVDAAGRLDLEKMIAASNGAGVVFLCNPNNPTATVHGGDAVADAVSRISQASPDTVILVDEAYHEYVTDPSYRSAVSLIGQYPKMIVSRTFSKLHGMAGMRIGYAMGQPEIIRTLSSWLMPYNVSAMALGAAHASLSDEAGIAREQQRNTAVRQFTLDFFRNAGFETTDSQTNFVFIKLGRPAGEFRDACREQGISVGREFPPMEKEWARISIGTQDEMDKAVTVFKSVLNV